MTTDPTPLTDDEWRAFQAIPDQGYSHRGWVDRKIAQRVRKAQADTLRDAADGINARLNEPELIRAADRYAGFYAGVRDGLQRDERALRDRATDIEKEDRHG